MARPKIALAAYVPGSANKTGAAPLVGTRGSLIQLINMRANSIKTKATVAAVVVFIWKQQQKLTALDAASGHEFGNSISIYGNTAIVGARSNNDAGLSSGSAYIFTYDGSTWTQQDKLTASDAAASDEFGYSVGIYGNTAIVGARTNDDAGSNSGSAYVFTYDGINWTEQQKLTASDAAGGDQFGYSVSIYEDTAIIGAFGGDSAYVFTTTTGVAWTEQQKLTASDAAPGDQFGYSVSIYGDSAIVGARLDDDAGSSSGSAYVFTRSGTNWTEQQKLTASDAAAEDLFGTSVSIYGDSAIIGAPFDVAGGSAYVFTRSGTTWTQQAKLTADDAAASDKFGTSVSIYGDSAIIGAPFDNGASGAAYVYTRSGTNWTQQQKLTASDAAGGDDFGTSVSIYGNSAIVGAPDDDTGRGSAYVFNYTSQ